jgi:hypothetical protein
MQLLGDEKFFYGHILGMTERLQYISGGFQERRTYPVSSRVDGGQPARRRSAHVLKKPERSEVDYFFSKEWVADEVRRVKSQRLAPGETPWYHLAGTGFWVKEQVANLIKNTPDAGDALFPSVLELELTKVRDDVQKFEEEYLQQMASIRWNLAWGEVGGQKRVICPDYGGVLWESATGKNEREGVVYDTLFGNPDKGIIGVEEKLRDAPNDTFVVMVSPEGWSGLLDADGRKIRYPESQVYAIHKKPDGELETYTFRYDATIFQSEELQRRLGLTVNPDPDQKERIKQTFSNVAFINPREERAAIHSFADLINVMQETVGGRPIAYGGDGNPKTFDQIREFITDPQVAEYHPLTEKLIDRFANYARWVFTQQLSPEDLEINLQIAMALTPLHMNRVYRDEAKDMSFEEGRVFNSPQARSQHGRIGQPGSETRLINLATRGMDYQTEKTDLQKRPGCAGGGEEERDAKSMGGSRKGVVGNEVFNGLTDNYFDHEGNCVNCGGGPKPLGPCNICIPCDAGMGGKGGMLMAS